MKLPNPIIVALIGLLVLLGSSNIEAQKIEDIHYSLEGDGKIYLHYRVRGKSDEKTLQLRIAYSHISQKKRKQWLTLKRDYLDVKNGEIYWVGRVELANIRNFIETAEVRFELINSKDIVDQHYFENLLNGAKEVEPEVFVPIASKEPVKKKEDKKYPEPKILRKVDANAKIFGGKAFRRLEGRRIYEKCNGLKDMRFVQEGVAWIFVGVNESGKVTTAIFTVQTTTGEQSTITDPDQKQMARSCAKAYRFASAKGQGNQYGFIPIYFRNP